METVASTGSSHCASLAPAELASSWSFLSSFVDEVVMLVLAGEVVQGVAWRRRKCEP